MKNTLEGTVVAVFPWLVGGLIVAAPLLLVPASDDRRWDLLIHLSVLVIFALGLIWRLSTIDTSAWFSDRGWSDSRRFLVAATALIVVVTGVTALVTLASSAALRFEPSLQFLQLLSALDIAWVVAGTSFGMLALAGRLVSRIAGLAMAIICVMSIALYLAEVGLTADQGWLLDGEQLMRLVLPFDVAAALITIGLLVVAARRSQLIEQARPQS